MRYFAFVLVVMAAACHGGPDKNLAEGTQYHVGAGYPRRFGLPDGSEVLAMPNTTVGLAKGFGRENRDLVIEGEAVVEVTGTAAAYPFTVHTRDLVIEVLEGGSRFHVAADRSKPGEEVDLLKGKLRARKSYHSSTDNEPETLVGGEMVMINQDIDLMEKEKLSSAELDKLQHN